MGLAVLRFMSLDFGCMNIQYSIFSANQRSTFNLDDVVACGGGEQIDHSKNEESEGKQKQKQLYHVHVAGASCRHFK